MKKGKGERVLERSKNTFVFVFVLLLFVALIAIGYFSGFFGKITTFDTATSKSVGVNITVGAPVIIEVLNGTGTMSLSAATLSTSRVINFTVYHGAGSQFLNDSTAYLNITLVGGVGELLRNNSCTRLNQSANYVTYSCNITMWWWDGAGNWNITAEIEDNNSNVAINSSTTLFVGSTTGFEMSPNNLTWAAMGLGATNQSSNNDPLVLNNTGNQPIGNATGTSNISINATDLKGETNNIYSLFANNFSAGPVGGSCPGAACTECGGGYAGNFSRNKYANVTNVILPKGNYTKQDGTGQEQIFFCLRIAGYEIISQAYSTVNMTAWTVKIG